VETPTNTVARGYVPYAGDILLHRVFLAMATAVIALSFLMSSEGKTEVFLPFSNKPMPETCTSKRLLGVDCPGCGLTRAFICISHGEFAKAWKFNAASFLVYAFVFVQIPWHSIQLWRIRNGKFPMEPVLVYFLPIAIAVALMVNWIIRIWPALNF